MPDSAKKTDFETLRGILLELNPSAESHIKAADTDLFEIGALDSVSVIELIPFLERYYEFNFDFTDLRAKNFRSIATLAALLKNKYGL